MTKAQKAEWAALAGVRAAVKGWAFVSKDKLPGYIAYAEEKRDKVESRFHAAADLLIQPLRDAV